MGIEENKVIMQRYFDELMNNGDYSKADEILHQDFIAVAAGGLKGINGHKQYRDSVLSIVSDGHIEVQEIVAEEDKAVVFSEWSAIHDKGNFLGVPPTGKKVTFNMVGVYGFKDGKIKSGAVRTLSNQLPVFQQLGVLPSNEEFIQAYIETLK